MNLETSVGGGNDSPLLIRQSSSAWAYNAFLYAATKFISIIIIDKGRRIIMKDEVEEGLLDSPNLLTFLEVGVIAARN